MPAYSYAYFAPGIIQTYGYSPIQTQLHSVPPWAAAFGFAMFVASISDAVRHRFAFAIGCICIAIVGFGILIAIQDNNSLQYGALFLVGRGRRPNMAPIANETKKVTSGTYTAM